MSIDHLLNKIHNMDCLEFMRDMPDNCVDLVLTDPPYGVGLGYDVYDDTQENWEDLFTRLIPECKRIAKMTIMPSCQIKKLPFIYATHPPDWLIAWHKGSTGCAAYIGFNDWEPLLVYGRTKNQLFMHDHFQVTPEPFKCGHPCPKPAKWARWLIKRATDPNGIVFDPFIGSGTTAFAAWSLRRQFIGCEISEEYCKIARKRIQEEKDKYGLFENHIQGALQ